MVAQYFRGDVIIKSLCKTQFPICLMALIRRKKRGRGRGVTNCKRRKGRKTKGITVLFNSNISWLICLLHLHPVLRPRMSLTRRYHATTIESLVFLVCNVTSQPYPVIHWWHNNIDVTSLSSGVVWTPVYSLSTSILQFDFPSADDIASKYECVRQNQSSRSVECTTVFSCTAFYSGLKSETWVARSATVSITLCKYRFMSVCHIETSDLL